MIETLLYLILAVALVGVLLYLVNYFFPLPPPVMVAIAVVILVVVALFLLRGSHVALR